MRHGGLWTWSIGPARCVLAGVLMALLAGCGMFNTKSRDEALKELTWSYEADGIQLQVEADPMLNATDGQPHTLLLVLVQMADPNAFTAYSRQKDKLASLLLAESAPDGMLDLQRFYIEPGSKRDIKIPRIESAKYVGLAAGYAHLDPSRSARLYQIGVDVHTSGWVFRENEATPQPLAIRLLLGADGIQDSLSSRAQPAKPTQPAGGLVEPEGPFPASVLRP